MKWKGILAKPVAGLIAAKNYRLARNMVSNQFTSLSKILKFSSNTSFGQDFRFKEISNYEEFKHAVPVQNYEGIKSYINRIISGEKDVLWPGAPLYLAKTSGTTSGAKYIPLTKESIPNHIGGARNLLMHYIARTGNADFLNHKMIFLSGSPLLDRSNIIPVGRLSGIVNRHVPTWAKGNQLPTWEINCMEDWEEKLASICDQTMQSSMGLISGIPPWMQMYFDWLIERSGKNIGTLFPNLSVLAFGGVNFQPYKKKLLESVGRPVDLLETFPASEGFFAFQDGEPSEGMLLQPDKTVFFEFIPLKEYGKRDATRLSVEDVALGENYALVITNTAGLWAYDIGDVVQFTSLDPFRIKVTGRTKHFLSAFGEHVISEEVDRALQKSLDQFPQADILEYHVAPQVNPEKGLPYHEWFLAVKRKPSDVGAFSRFLNQEMTVQNIYYKDLMDGRILEPLKIRFLEPDAFKKYMASQGKLGGQNKVPRLANDRRIADAIKKYQLV
jgi:hypothetical protein